MQNSYDDNNQQPSMIPSPINSNYSHDRYINRNNTNSATFPHPGISDSIFRPASVINLSNSNDVVIGPMTQYQGTVTIYQYMDATVDSLYGRPNNLAGIKTSSNGQNKSTCNCDAKLWILLFICLVITAGVSIALYFEYVHKATITSPKSLVQDILFGNEYEGRTIPNLGNGHLVIDRKQWGATNVSTTGVFFPLAHPIPYVIITHIGVQSKPCDNVYNCSIKMRTIQDSAIAEKKLFDISANFYVSNDGYIYVGRGWNVANAYSNKSLAISFMGDYMRYEPTELQIDGVQHLLIHGVARQYLAPNYKIIAHNQTQSTKSPGAYVYKEIIKWPRWYPCGINENPKCDI